MQLIKKDKQFLTYLSILVGLYILPIILADFYYVDDFSKSLTGNVAWKNDGRLITFLLFKLLSFGYFILDLSPLNQVLSGILLIFSGFLIYKKLFSNLNTFLASLTAFLFIANPFFLENLSYKYDALSMSLSILTAISSFILGSRGNIKNLFYSLLLLLSTLLIYQPSITIFIGLVMINFIQEFLENKNPKESLSLLLKLACITLFSYFLYDIISKPFIKGWAEQHNSMVSLNSNGLFQLWVNIKNSFNFISVFFKDKITLYLFLVPFIISCIYNIYLSFTKFQTSKKDVYSILGFILVCLSPFLLYFIMLIPIIPLQNPIIVPRVLIGFSLLLFFSFLGFTQFLAKTNWKYIIVFPALYCMVLSYSYSNAQKSQKIFEVNLINYITEDLKSMNKIEDIEKIIFNGNEPHSLQAQLFFKKFPIIKRIFYPYLTGEWVTYYVLSIYSPILNKQEVYRKDTTKSKEKMLEFAKLKPIKSNPIYSMKILGDTALIEYKEQE